MDERRLMFQPTSRGPPLHRPRRALTKIAIVTGSASAPAARASTSRGGSSPSPISVRRRVRGRRHRRLRAARLGRRRRAGFGSVSRRTARPGPARMDVVDGYVFVVSRSQPLDHRRLERARPAAPRAREQGRRLRVVRLRLGVPVRWSTSRHPVRDAGRACAQQRAAAAVHDFENFSVLLRRSPRPQRSSRCSTSPR